MLQLVNITPFQAERAVQLDQDGNQIWVVIVKATYLINEQRELELHAEQEPVCLVPRYSGEPGKSSLLRECEAVFEHPGPDIILNATAHAPRRIPTQMLDVVISVGQVQMTLRVFGDRYWKPGLYRPQLTSPEFFTEMPIVYENAFGGADDDDPESERTVVETRNPIGRGMALKARHLVGQRLPNIEDPNDLIQDWRNRPYPAGFGAIPSNWSPRKEYAGTLDETWRRERMPLWPVDYDPRHHQSAHPALVSVDPLRGGERVNLIHLSPDSPLSFRLPSAHLIADTYVAQTRLRQPVQLDRIIIEPDDRKVLMVWRSSLNCRSQVGRIEKTVVSLKPRIKW
jgi:hypothetical protein